MGPGPRHGVALRTEGPVRDDSSPCDYSSPRPDALLLGQQRILEMIAKAAPLNEILTELMLFIEAQEVGLTCGILRVADDSAHFRRGAGPHLPERYHAALDGVPITPPYLGACGEVAHQGVVVEIADIATNTQYTPDWRGLVLGCGLKSMRSMPVRASDGRVLASFAMYYDRPHHTGETDKRLIDIATHLAGIAIERAETDERLRLHDEASRPIDALNMPVSVAKLKKTEAALAARVREHAALYRFTDRLYRGASLDDTYEAALDAIFETLYCSRASILLFDDDGVMRFVAWRGLSENYRRSVEGHTPWKPGETNAAPICIGDIDAAAESDSLKAIVKAEGIGALAFIPLTADSGVIGKFMAYYPEPRVFDEETLNLALTVARQLGFSLERARSDAARRQAEKRLQGSERRLAQELATAQQLREIGSALIREGDTAALYQEILDAAVMVMRSDFASMQVLIPERGAGGELRLVASRGFSPEGEKFWEWVGVDTESICGAALRRFERVIVPDFEKCDFMSGTDNLAIYLQAGIRAAQTTPLVSRSGRLLGMISTHWRTPHQPPIADLRRLDVLARQAADLIDRAHAAEALRQSEERLRAVFDSAAVGVAILAPDARFIEVNDAFVELCGYSPDELRSLDSIMLTHPDDRSSMTAHLDELIGGRRSSFVIEKRYCRKDGSIIWVQNSVSLTHDSAGHPMHLFKLVQDITERKLAERRQKLLVDELNHRVKNTLATVQSFAIQTLRSAPTLAEGQKAFEARLIALSKTHDVLTRERWEGADIRDVVGEAITPYRRPEHPRFQVSGERLRLQPKAVLALSLALHELATNAVKYGALSNDTGSVSVQWQVEPKARRFKMCWKESDGPAVAGSRRRGFGSRLIEQGLSQDIDGDVRLDFAPDGLMCAIDAPLHEVAA